MARACRRLAPRCALIVIVAVNPLVMATVGKGPLPIRTGDVVRIPPNVHHWHGAAAETAMSHVAIAESVDGSSVTWLEQVSDDAYRGQ